jgi:hypothetical protein
MGAVRAGGPYLHLIEALGFLIIFVLFLGVYPTWMEMRRAKRIKIQREGLQATTYNGRLITWKWNDITEVSEYRVRMLGHTERFGRLTVGLQILYISTDRFKDFEKVMAAIHARTPHARTDGPLDRIERYIMNAKPLPPTMLAVPTCDDSRG